MKSLTVRLPEPLVADIEAESRGRKVSKSDVVRKRLERASRKRRRTASLTAIADLIGSVGGLPADLTARKKDVDLTSRRPKRITLGTYGHGRMTPILRLCGGVRLRVQSPRRLRSFLLILFS
jgi:Arc/MetJ-type ribon-helix-helix transcriptional regulator